MAGVRIQHPTERSCTFVLVDAQRPYPVPFNCPKCKEVHLFKATHIVLDETGAGIVSVPLWERLQEIPLNPFRVANEVKQPPVLRLVVDPVKRTVRALAPGQ